MEIYIKKINPSSREHESLTLNAKRIKNINFADGLTAAFVYEVEIEGGKKTVGYEFKKVEMMTSLKLDDIKGDFIAIHYYNQGELHTSIISDLPNNHYDYTRPILFNYKYYVDVCSLTREDTLPFKEFFTQFVINENNSINSLEKYGKDFLNWDEQRDMYTKTADQ